MKKIITLICAIITISCQKKYDENIYNSLISKENIQIAEIENALKMYEGKKGIEQIENILANGVNGKDEEGQTALMLASYYDYPEIADVLIKNGADVNAKNKNKDTPLLYAAYGFAVARNDIDGTFNGEYTKIVPMLIEAGADVNIRDQEYDKTPLIIASEDAYIDMMKILIEAGADVNAKDGFNKERASLSAYGQTPLMYVVNKSSIEGIKMLISAGADVNAKDHFGKTVLSIAHKNDDKEIINILGKAGAK